MKTLSQVSRFALDFRPDSRRLTGPRARVAARYFVRAALIFANSVKQDIVPVLFLPPKLALNLAKFLIAQLH